MPRFSVIIPLYNKENYIAGTIASVLNQTFSDFELIIVNDCATDNSLEIAQTIKDPRIQIIQHSVNKGLSASRNTGIKKAQSDFVAFLDADDLWKPTYLEKIDFLITNFPEASLFATKYEVLLSNGKTLVHDFKITDYKSPGIVPNFFENNLNQNLYYPSCLTARKSVFESIGYYNEAINFSEDVDFNIRAHEKFKFAYWNEAHVTYVLDSENQITQNGLSGKTIPDYDFYEKTFPGRKDIKTYLDFQRFVKAKLFKLSGDTERASALINQIDPENLNRKQKLLLRTPKPLLLGIGFVKKTLQKLGIELNSYS